MTGNKRMGDGATTKAGNSIPDEAPALVDAKQVTGKGRKSRSKDHQGPPDKIVGSKRKADEIECAPATEDGPSTSKRQLLGLGFLSTALKTLNPLKNISKFMKWGRGDVGPPVEAPQPSVQDEPLPAIAGNGGDPAPAEEPVAIDEEVAVEDLPVETQVEEEVIDVVDDQETLEEEILVAPVTALPVVVDATPAAAPAAPIEDLVEPAATLPVPTVNRPEPPIYRKSSHYSPPVAKDIKVVKRSELKRQLQEQRQAPPATVTTTKDAPLNPPVKKSTNASGNYKSRGSRLLTMAHDTAPQAVVTMALAPPSKTPRAAFGLNEKNEAIITPPARVEQQQAPQEGDEQQDIVENINNEQGGEEVEEEEQVVAVSETATIPVALEPSPEARTAVQTPPVEEQLEEEASPVEEVEKEVEELPESGPLVAATTEAAAAAAEPAQAPATSAQPTATNPSSGVSGSPLSLALWGEATKQPETEREESHGTVNGLVSMALAAMMGGVAVDGDVEIEKENEKDEAVAMEIDAAVAPEAEEATPLPEPEVIVHQQQEEEKEKEDLLAAAEENDEEDNEEEEKEKDAVAGLIDGTHGNQFTPLPRLLPRWGNNPSGGDSAATSPSSFCSLLPAGLSGGRNPTYKISKPGTSAPAAANSPSVALRSHKSNSGKDDGDGDDVNDGAASTHLEEGGTGRRVRFFGVEEISKEEENVDQELLLLSQQQQQDGEGGTEQRETVCRPSIRPLPPPVCRPSSANGRTHLTGAQPRFGIGAFVRIPAIGSNGTAATAVQPTNEGGNTSSPPDAAAAAATTAGATEASVTPGAAAATGKGVDDTSPPANLLQINIDQETATPLVITRRLQHSGTLLRRAAALLPPLLPTSESVPQLLREAFLNARLTEHWCRGEAWARLDLSGIELVRDGDREAHLNAVIATLTGQRGDTAVQAALDQLQIEWEHLKCFRQKYVSSPTAAGTASTTAAPKSILKHASGVSPLFTNTAAGGAGGNGSGNDHTPPLDRNLPGFEDILAAEVVPGSTSPRDWAIGAITAGGNHTGQLTPGITVRSRGIKMLASLHHQAATTAAAAAGGGGNGNGTVQEGANAPGSGQTADAVGNGGAVGVITTRAATAAAAAAAAEEQQRQLNNNNSNAQQQVTVAAEGRRRGASNGTRRGGSRGHRLLQALQNAAGPNGAPTTAAAAAARLIVDSSAAGGDGGDFMTGPMATSFVVGL